MRSLIYLSVSFLFLTTGCNRYQGTDETEKNHPKLIEALDLVRVQDLDGAEDVLLDFLYNHPEYALTHVQLGILYQTKKEPINALYHFQKYLEMRPDSKKAVTLKQVVKDERRRLANMVFEKDLTNDEGSPEFELQQLREKLAEAQQKQAEAEVRLQQLQRQTGRSGNEAPSEWATEKLQLLARIRSLEAGQGGSVVTEEPVVENAVRTYTVKRGDTLSRISQKMYGEASQWRIIYDANRAKIPNQNALKLGTELVIPHE